MFKLRFLYLILVLLLSSCSSAKTSIAPESKIKPVLLKGTQSQIMDIVYSTAKRVFPGEPCERNDEKRVVKIHRNWFWRGDTLLTVSLTSDESNNWLVHVTSEGVGFNQPIGDMSTSEVIQYLDELITEYNQFIKNQKEKEITIPKSLSQKLHDLQSAFDNGLISQEEYQRKRQELLEKF